MGTRSAAFTAKVRNLQDFQIRLTNGVVPLPTGLDIANTLKHFSQTLIVILKDVPDFPLEMLKSRDEDADRLQLFPNLDYKALFNVVVQLIDAAPMVQIGIQGFGQSILQTIASLLPFLDHECIDTLPYIVSASLGTFPPSLHQDIIDLLCHYILPFTLYNCQESERYNYAYQSVSAILMMVFQYTTDSEFHCQVMECIMTLKRDVVKDIFCVIAYGTSEARNVAINLLVYYWPHLNPTLYDRRSINFKFNGYKTPICRSEMCSINNSGGCADAVKICLDHSIGVALAPENPPPLFLCHECASRLQHDQPDAADHLYDVLQPIQQVSMTCENKNCRSENKAAITICFSSECASYNGTRPIRYCAQCHSIRHNNRRGGDHVFHMCLQTPVKTDNTFLNYEVEAIVSLLLEAEPINTRGGMKETFDQQTRMRLFTDGEFNDPISLEERRLMGRYAIWLLVGFFNLDDPVSNDVLGRLLSALFQWFNTTAYLGDDPSANYLERLKSDVVCPWIRKVIASYFDTFVSCLLPHPPEYSRVGGHWDVISSRTFHLKEGFNRIFCLVPYEVISTEIWSQIMPNWMEAMASEVPEEEMSELKVILSKVMDPEMNPLGFDARQMYQFIAVRFHQTSHKVKEQALRWLQVLSKLEIVIPLYFIFSIFREGIRVKGSEKQSKRGSVSTEAKEVIAAICQDDSRNPSSLSDDEESLNLQTEQQSDSELMLSSFIFMCDVILKQLELQEVEQHKGLQTIVAKDAMVLLNSMVSQNWPGKHTCQREQECQFCEMSVLWYQLALEIVQKLAPKDPSIAPDVVLSPDGEFGNKPFPEEKKLDVKSDTKPSVSPKEPTSLEGMILSMPQVHNILTATVETVSDLDLAPIMPAEKVVKAVARAVTITESDTASATAHVALATLVDEEGESKGGQLEESGKDFWVTSVGKFKFSIEELPPYLQFTYQLLKKLPDEEDSELLYHLLKCLKILFLHCEVMLKASRDHRGFLVWCQENLLIKNLWDLMDAEYSQICEQAVPILLHCITLPIGADVFWKQIEDEFHNPDWRMRFTAVERVITITRFMDTHPLRSSQSLQTALANAFCYCISSLDDSHVAVAQRTALYLGTIHDSALMGLIFCLQSQFDTVPIDRPLILQSLYMLLNSVSDRKLLRWDFFLNCFDTLFIEAQLHLERCGDISFAKDFKNIETYGEYLSKKIGRLQESFGKLEPHSAGGGGNPKTLYSSLGKKVCYKRTMSAPPGFTVKSEKEKLYNRQASAPVLKRKGSRHTSDVHIQGILNENDSHLVNLFNKISDLEENDKETMHLIVFLFMQFLSKYTRGPIPSENKSLGRTQSGVLRHLNILLGYNHNEKTFFSTPSKLRCSTVFNSFIANLSQVLDQNFKVGAIVIPLALTVLHYVPAPNKASGLRPHPFYSLWYLDCHIRRYWLTSVIVVLYKYEYGNMPVSSQIQGVIRIILNTLNAHEHRCRPLPTTLMLDEPSSRSRDMSQATLNADDHETPPVTPGTQGFSSARDQRKSVSSVSSSAVRSRKSGVIMEHMEHMSSQEGTEPDDMEPELAAIPESPKSSESGEVMTSVQDLVIMEPIKAETIQARAHAVQPLLYQSTESPFHTAVSDSAKVVDAVRPQQEPSKPKNWFLIGGGNGDSAKSSSSGTSSSSKGGGGTGEMFPWHLSVQAAFQIAKIPAPPLERLLPVGFNPPPSSPVVKSRSRSGAASPYESPESPMSKMDMISIGPSVRVDDDGDGDSLSLHRAEINVVEKPPVERLLSLGPGGEKYSTKPEDIKGLHKGDYGSPKKLVKQTHVCDSDSVFESEKPDLSTEKSGEASDMGKSVGFAQYTVDSSLRQLHVGFKQSSLRVGEDCIQDRCSDCGAIVETFNNEELGLCIVALETFVHREPGLAAPLMPELLKAIARVAVKPLYPWQAESNTYLPGGVSSVAHQFFRCVLHQLAPYGVFTQLFQTKFPERVKVEVFKAISYALADFNELNPVAPLQLLFEALNSRKSVMIDTVGPIIDNVATYLECLPLEAASATWSAVIPLCEVFFRKLIPLSASHSTAPVDGLLRTVSCLMRLPGISAFKSILDPFSKILGFALQNCEIKFSTLLEVCSLCHRAFTREREKFTLTRAAIFELYQAIKFKSEISDKNFLMILGFLLQDSGGSLAPFVYIDDFPKFQGIEPLSHPSTGASECMKQHLIDSIDFIADFHSLSKIKSNYKSVGSGLTQEALGVVIKGGISQFIALEISRGNTRENRAIGRYLPWLYNTLSSIQQGPKEFLDCVAHIRVLSWVLLGSLTLTALYGNNVTPCIPIPFEASCHIADHVHVILTGFAEQSKASVLHMSSLFYAFILCQVWTVYLEHVGPTSQQSGASLTDPLNLAGNILIDFWGKVTPAILQMVKQSKVMAEVVSLHFLALLESLLECNSSVFNRLLPLWSPVLNCYPGQLPSNVQVRLQRCLSYPPPETGIVLSDKMGAGTVSHSDSTQTGGIEFPAPHCGPVYNILLLKWVQLLQFKMGKIELQSSAATQFCPP